MLEKQVEKEVRLYAIKKGCLPLKLAGPGNRGMPDRLFFYRGRTLPMELKRPGKKPTVLQHKWLAKFEEMGFPSCWTDTPAGGKNLIDDFVRAVDDELDNDDLE